MKTLKYVGFMKKKALIFIAVPIALVLAGVLIGQAWLKSRFERDSIIKKLEAQWNCRVSLDSTSVSLFSSPASVELRGIKFSIRDGEVGKPISQRAALDEKNILIAANHVILAVALEDVIRGRLNVSQLQILDLTAKTEVDDNGVSTLQGLFKAPLKNDISLIEKEITQSDKQKTEQVKQETNTPFKAEDMRISLTVQDAGMKNAKMEVTSQKNGSKITFENVRFELKGIDVVPTDLVNHNRCGFYFEGGIRIEEKNQKDQVANFNLTGSGSMRPFDENTGEWSPDLNLEVKVKKGGLVGGALLTQQLDKKDLKKLNDYGLELGGIALGGVLQEDASTKIHQVRGKLFIKQDTKLVFPQYEITLLEKSWFNAQQDMHLVRAKLILSEDLSAQLLAGAKIALSAKYGESLASVGLGVLGTTLMDDKMRIVLPFKSKGSLSKPEVDMDSLLNDAKDLLKDAGKSLLQGLLGK